MGQEEISFELFYLQLWRSSCSTEWDKLCHLSRGHYSEPFTGNILNLDQWVRRRYLLNYFLSSAGWQSCTARKNKLGNVGRGHYGESFSENILNLDQWVRRIYLLNYLLSTTGW